MKRTLKNTDRTVKIVVDNEDRHDIWADNRSDIWTANVYIDGSFESVEMDGLPAFANNPTFAFTLATQAIEKSDELNDLPVPVPEKDYELLCSLMRGIASTWGHPADIPDWRENEYIRGQLELVIETCRVVTDEEFADGTGDSEMLRDRITTWLEAEVWK
jgi:hypothetical protein